MRSQPYPNHLVQHQPQPRDPFRDLGLRPALTPPRIPPNLKFEVDDVEKEWTYPFKFDFVVSRYMCGSISDWPAHAKRIYEYEKPSRDSLD